MAYRYRQGKPYGLHIRFDFSEHKGELVQDVIRKNPGFVCWCLENVPGFELTPEAETELDDTE